MSGVQLADETQSSQQLTFKREAGEELRLAPHVHLKVAGVDSAQLGLHTVLMHLLPQLLALSDPHLLIERQFIAHLVMAPLLRGGVGMRGKTGSLCACLSVRAGERLELGLLIAELGLIVLHLIVALTSVSDHATAVLGHAKVLLLDAVEDLLLLQRRGAHVVGDIGVKVVGQLIGGLDRYTSVVLCLKQVLLG